MCTFYPGTGYLMKILLYFDISLATRWNTACLYLPFYCLRPLKQLCNSSVLFHEAAFSNLAVGALLWNDALTSFLLIGMWLNGAYLGCLSCGSVLDVIFKGVKCRKTV